jgi:hypothetical protein
MSDPMQTQQFSVPPTQSFEPTPGPERQPNRKLLYILLGGGVAVVALLGITIAAVVFFLSGRSNAIPQFLSADTQLYAALNPNLSDVPNLQRLQESFPELLDQQSDESPVQSIEELMGIDFEADVTPWIGTEIAFAATDFDLSQLNTNASSEEMAELAQSGDLLIVLASRDDVKAQAFLDKQRAARQEDGASFAEVKAGNVTIYEQEDSDGNPITAFTYYNKHVFFANSAEALQAVVERDTGSDQTLQANPRYQAVLKGLPEGRLGHVFIDGLAFGAFAEMGFEQAAEQLTPEQAARLEEQAANIEALRGLGLSFVAVGEGLQFDSAISFDLAKLTEQAKAQLEEARTPVDAKRVDTISNEAISLFTFKIPASFKEQILQTINDLPDGQEQREQFESQFNLDLEKDFLDWFVGDASLVILPGDKIGDVELPATGYFAIRPADRAAAEAGMKKIFGVLEEAGAGNITIEENELGGASWQAVVEPNTNDLIGGYGFVGDDLVLAFGTRAMELAGGGSSAPVSGEATYKQATGSLANPNGGYFYIDVQKVIGAIDAANLGETIDADVRSRLEPIKAISAAGEPGVNADGLAKARLMVVVSGE